MAWNRPETGNTATKTRKPGSPMLAKGLLAGIVVAGAVAIAVIALLPRPQEPAKNAAPAAAEPQGEAAVSAPAPKAAEPAKEAERKWPDKPPRGEKLWRHGEGPRSVAVTNGMLVTYPNYPGVKMILPNPAHKLPFKDFSDNEIASILSIKPGGTAIQVPLPRNFDQKFAESLLNPIEITEDDTPEQAEMKRQVIEARKILAEAVRRGESPREILTAERKNLHRLMTLRDNYQQIVREQLKNGASAQDIADTVKAANEILRKEGVDNPVVLPYKQALILKEAREAGEIED